MFPLLLREFWFVHIERSRLYLIGHFVDSDSRLCKRLVILTISASFTFTLIVHSPAFSADGGARLAT